MSRSRVRTHTHKREPRRVKKTAKASRALSALLKVSLILAGVSLLILLFPFGQAEVPEGGISTEIPENLYVPQWTGNTETSEVVEDVWRDNIAQEPIANRINMVWDDPPRALSKVPPGVNVLAPCWFDLKANEDGSVYYEERAVEPESYVKMSREAGVEVWGTIQSFNPDISAKVVTDLQEREIFISKVVGWVEQYDLDGINLDFEKMNPEHKQQYNEFCKALNDRLPEDIVLSVCVTVKLLPENPNNWWQCYDRAGLAEAVDYVCVMTYDAHKNSTKEPVASVQWVDTHIRRLLEEVPSEKLIMGIPFHGTDYRAKVTNTTTLDKEPLWKSSGVTTTVFQLNLLLTQGYYQDRYGSERDRVITLDYWLDQGSWNDEYGISNYSFVDTDGTEHTIWIDDENSLYQKTQMSIDYNLAGIAVWKRSLGTDPMFDAIAQAFRDE